MKSTKIRIKILKAFSIVLFFSFLLTGVIFNVVIRVAVEDRNILTRYGAYDTTGIVGRAGLILVILVAIMFAVTMVVTYFLAKSITRPIEQLSTFALRIGDGDFTPNDSAFKEKELEDLNIALNKSVKQLRIYDNEQKTFFQNASHELRTPLMSIKCYAEGISFGIIEPAKASETILHETDKLSDLVTDLLYISKIDNITTAYKTTEVDLAALIKDCAAGQEAVAEKNNIRFSFDFDKEPILYNCVGELISRAIVNLISNAIRYAKSEIVLSCHKNVSGIKICVADDGSGIEPELMPHIFERFYKGKNGNHGIGLAIVKSIVEQQGGHVIAENINENGGAMFTIELSD